MQRFQKFCQTQYKVILSVFEYQIMSDCYPKSNYCNYDTLRMNGNESDY